MQTATPVVPSDIEKYVTHHYADNQGVRIHYALIGQGPLIIMIHGFPDFWYTWRNQMVALAHHFQVVALDLRGYNLSDKPNGGENYSMHHLIGDVRALMRHLGRDKTIIVGHDWGGAIAWQFAIHLQAMVERLIILNMPHPRGLIRELAQNAQQQKQSAYARKFQEESAHKRLTPESLSTWVHDTAARENYIKAFRRSDFEAMLHYYKQNYPRPPYQDASSPVIKIEAPVLQIHGLQDPFLLPGGLNNTWEWVRNDWTLLTVPQAGHFVQHDAAAIVTRTIINWLACNYKEEESS
jgi:pimeloyl-ACP methyl ester carboxylesterase